MIWCTFSILHCIVASFPCTLQTFHYTYHWLTPESCTLCIFFFLALSAKSFCDCKYLSTIACASEDTFGESTAAKFLLDYSPLFDMYGVPSRLLFATYTSTLGMLDFSTHVFAYRFLICRPIISFTNFIKSLSLRVTFLLNFWHGLSIDRSHVHLSIYKQSFYQEFQQISKWCSFKTRWGKSDTLDCHMGVTWFDAARWLAASRRLLIFLLKYCDMS